jgi:hypothetical protein
MRHHFVHHYIRMWGCCYHWHYTCARCGHEEEFWFPFNVDAVQKIDMEVE